MNQIKNPQKHRIRSHLYHSLSSVNLKDARSYTTLSKEVVNIAQQDHKLLRMVISEARLRGMNVNDQSPPKVKSDEGDFQLPAIKPGRNRVSQSMN